MNEIRYYLAIKDENMVIKSEPNSLLRKFDIKTKKWVEDVELAQIYFGGILTKPITVDEAKKYTGGIQ